MKNSSRSSSSSSSSGDQRYKRIKLDSSSESPSSTEVIVTPSANMKTQAAFVNKLYKMLEDEDTSDLIAWSTFGDLFSVSNPTAFSKIVLPQYFKHNNWQSFVRQLNMYGFHKVNDLIHSNLTNENQTWEFKHPNFKRGEIGDLQHIKRKSPRNQQLLLQQKRQQQQQQSDQDTDITMETQVLEETPALPSDENETVIKYILRIEDHLSGVSKSCEQLFNEVVHLRMVVSKQQDAMQDLVDVVSSLSNCCECSTKNNQDLQNAENLRIQVSKLKSNNNTNWKYTNDQKRLPSFDTIQYNNNSKNTTDTFNRKSSASSSASSSSTSIQRFSSNPERPRSSTMSFGKQSHMLNPMEDKSFSRQRNNKYK